MNLSMAMFPPAAAGAAKGNAPVRSTNVERVAIVISQLRVGGAERVVVHLAAALASLAVQPLVICIKEKGEFARELEPCGVPVVALQSLRGYDVRAVFRLAGQLRAFQPSVVNVHDYSSVPYVVLAGFLSPRCPIVFTAHGLLYEGFEALRRRYRFFSRRLAAIVAVSPQVRDRHVSYLNWPGTTHVIPNGVPDVQRRAEERLAVRKELGLDENEFVFLAVGNARPEKAFEDLIAAASEVRQQCRGRPFCVLIAGRLAGDAYGDQVRRAAQASGVEGLRLLGYRSDVERFYSAADAFVMSSRSEGLPMVLLEAMMAGLPVIGTRVGGIPEAVPADCGLLVDPGQPGQLAQAMLVLLTAKENVCERMGSQARQWAAKEFGVGKMVQRYLGVYAAEMERLAGKGGH